MDRLRLARLFKAGWTVATFFACLVGFGVIVQDHVVKYVGGRTGVSKEYKPVTEHEVGN